MTTTPSREDWENAFAEKFPNKLGEVIDDFGSTVKSDIKDFIRNILQNHNNALVAEIENTRPEVTERDSSGYSTALDIYGNRLTYNETSGYNKALDTIIRIIQEK